MQQIQYIGEHVFPGRLGHFLLITAFVASLLSSFSYFFSTSRKDLVDSETWKKIGRISFLVMGFAALGAIGILFYLMINQHYEYEYVWSHVAEHLPLKYIFPAFWEGQQGSFLLWIFWHTILGFVLIRVAKDWESSTLSVLALVQAILLSMILGIYFTSDFRLGVTPFALLRESENMAGLPIFQNANYLSMIEGKGLNPLLQNYWMIIHPPTLFLGFASVSIPFCYAVAGFWRKKYTEWIRPVLPWSLFSGAVLGTGIVMGGAWAYEALSFGGYWAWDPVENASLVPWLILIGGIHTNLVARSTRYSISSTYLFYGLAFLAVLYSTFLTRSGILGDSSVHAFTEMGLEWQLLIMIFASALIFLAVYLLRRKNVPAPAREESFSSREFWMFIGSLVLLFSAGLITFTTSLPVLNKILDFYGSLTGQDMSHFHRASPVDAVGHYNRFQLWIAVFIGFLSGMGQFLIYKDKSWAQRKKSFTASLVVSAILSAVFLILFIQWIKTLDFAYLLLLFAAIFSIVSNLKYFYSRLKLKLRASASVLSHVGFGIMILGIVASGINKRYISNNAFAMRDIFGDDEDLLQKNVYLLKGQPLFMGGFNATYISDTMIGYDRRYTIRFDRLDKDNKSVTESFELDPYITYNQARSEMVNPNPSTKRYIHKDIFSHITSAPARHVSIKAAQEEDDSLKYQEHNMRLGDTLMIRDKYFSLNSLTTEPSHEEYAGKSTDVAYGASIDVWDTTGFRTQLKPVLAVRDQRFIHSFFDHENKNGIRVHLTEDGLQRIYPDEGDLHYQILHKKVGEGFSLEGVDCSVTGFDKNPTHPSYIPKEGDIAVAAEIEIRNNSATRVVAKPIFLIRDNQTYMISDHVLSHGLLFRFSNIDPKSEQLELMVAKTGIDNVEIPVKIAFDAPRNDFIVLEAIEFPGINLFWLGTSMMMIGMLIGMYQKIKRKY